MNCIATNARTRKAFVLRVSDLDTASYAGCVEVSEYEEPNQYQLRAGIKRSSRRLQERAAQLKAQYESTN